MVLFCWMTTERRRKKFINSWAQLSIAAEVVLHSLLLLTLVALILFAPPFVTMFSDFSLEDHQAIAKELFFLNSAKWPLFAALALFVGLISILFSHHLVGPAFKFRRALGELSERNLVAIVKLRKWDYFQEVEEELNKHVARLKDDLEAIRSHQERASQTLRDAKGQLGSKAGEIENELEAIRQVVRNYVGLKEHPGD